MRYFLVCNGNKFRKEVNKEGGIEWVMFHILGQVGGRLLKKPITNLKMKNFISVLLLPFHREGKMRQSLGWFYLQNISISKGIQCKSI